MHRRFDVAVGRQHDGGRHVARFPQRLQEAETVQPGHVEIGQDHVGREGRPASQRFVAVGGGFRPSCPRPIPWPPVRCAGWLRRLQSELSNGRSFQAVSSIVTHSRRSEHQLLAENCTVLVGELLNLVDNERIEHGDSWSSKRSDAPADRILANEVVRQAAYSSSAALASLILLLLLGTQILSWPWLFVLPLSTLAAGAYATWRRVPSSYQVAQRVDRTACSWPTPCRLPLLRRQMGADGRYATGAVVAGRKHGGRRGYRGAPFRCACRARCTPVPS